MLTINIYIYTQMNNDIDSKHKYKNMFWKKHHECEQLKQLLMDNNIRFDGIINKYKGIIVKLSHNLDYGFINTNSESGIFFHITECENFILSETMLNKEIEFRLNKENGRVKAVSVSYTPIINVKSNNELLDILEDYNSDYNSDSNNLTTSVKYVEQVENVYKVNKVEKVDKVENVDKVETLETINSLESVDNNDINNIINKANNIWYMNCHEYSLIYWDKLLEGGYVMTWNTENRYKKIFDMSINDIIAWYIVGKGYIAILQLTEKPTKIYDDKEIDAIAKYCGETRPPSEARELWKQRTIKIPVKFLSVIDKDKCINHKDIPSIGNWSYGYRGSNCIKPKNEEWSNQVREMYKYMKS